MKSKKEDNKLWFEGEKTHQIILTDEDLKVVLTALDKLSEGHFAEKKNKFDIVKTRIYFQLIKR